MPHARSAKVEENKRHCSRVRAKSPKEHNHEDTVCQICCSAVLRLTELGSTRASPEQALRARSLSITLLPHFEVTHYGSSILPISRQVSLVRAVAQHTCSSRLLKCRLRLDESGESPAHPYAAGSGHASQDSLPLKARTNARRSIACRAPNQLAAHDSAELQVCTSSACAARCIIVLRNAHTAVYHRGRPFNVTRVHACRSTKHAQANAITPRSPTTCPDHSPPRCC